MVYRAGNTTFKPKGVTAWETTLEASRWQVNNVRCVLGHVACLVAKYLIFFLNAQSLVRFEIKLQIPDEQRAPSVVDLPGDACKPNLARCHWEWHANKSSPPAWPTHAMHSYKVRYDFVNEESSRSDVPQFSGCLPHANRDVVAHLKWHGRKVRNSSSSLDEYNTGGSHYIKKNKRQTMWHKIFDLVATTQQTRSFTAEKIYESHFLCFYVLFNGICVCVCFKGVKSTFMQRNSNTRCLHTLSSKIKHWVALKPLWIMAV